MKLKKLKSRKSVLLSDVGVRFENDIPKIKEQRNHNNAALEKISKRNDILTEYSETEKTQYREIKDNLSPEELFAVQEERRRIREDGIKGIVQKLKDTFGKKYEYDIFKEAETDASLELREKPLKNKSIQQQLQRK